MSDKMKNLIKIGLLAHLDGWGGANRHIFTFSRNITDLVKKKRSPFSVMPVGKNSSVSFLFFSGTILSEDLWNKEYSECGLKEIGFIKVQMLSSCYISQVIIQGQPKQNVKLVVPYVLDMCL